MFTFKFDMKKYSSLQNKILDTRNKRELTVIYARVATYNSIQNLHMCAATQMWICKMYSKVDYDFTNFVAS